MNCTLETAHLFGVGLSQTDLKASNQRGLAALAEVWPAVMQQLVRRFLQQALSEALPAYWLVRAERLEQVGTAWADAAARSCRAHAWLLATSGPSADVVASVDDVLGAI